MAENNESLGDIFHRGFFIIVSPAFVTAPFILQSNDIDIHDKPIYILFVKGENLIR
jgi:hypothetical protein